ncbi:MAG: efflux RND transporter permease subunit [Candidatus Omnitrophica bacterium]|nr:efflux RND transporter permease subunit [Candidatus Omnitrophota bacterium]
MSLPQFAVRQKVTVVMGTLALIGIGLISFVRLPQELFPPIVFPQVTIVTDYANAAPEEIETLITRPLEEAVGSVAGLKRIESSSREGRSSVTVSFNWGHDIDFAALAVREKIDLIKEKLPKEAQDPVVLKFDPLSRPILIISVSGSELEPVQLKLLAEKMLKDNLEKVEGVASATLSGGATREILVNMDQGRLSANHLSLLDVVKSIEETNVSYPAGSIKKGLYEYLIRTVGEFRSVKDIEYAVAGVDEMEKVRSEDTRFVEQGGEGPRETVDAGRGKEQKKMLEKRLVLLKDISQVIDGVAEKTSVSRLNGKENISISIQKQASANTIQVVDHLKKSLEFLKEDLRSRGLHFEIIYDHSQFIRKSLENLMSEALMGAFLVFLVLFAFLRAPGPSLLVTLSIPVTILGTFFLLALKGITLNTMSISGLVLSLGMIGDTSIVVLENIFRRRQMGENPEQGAIQGTLEVTWPVISSNLTTIAVCFPVIAFVPGIAGQIFKDLCWAIIFSQLISTLLPLTLIAMLSLYCKVKEGEYKPIVLTGILERRLLGTGAPAQKFGFAVRLLVIAAVICSTAFFIFPVLEREVLPKVEQGKFIIKVDLPEGSRLETTDSVCKKLEEVMKSMPEIKDVSVIVGSEKGREGEVKIEALRPSQALLTVILKKQRGFKSAPVVYDIREKIRNLPLEGAQIEFILQESEFQFAGGGNKPVEIEVKQYDLKKMGSLVATLKQKLSEIPGVIDIQDDAGKPIPETKLHIEKRRAALYGISALDISLTAKAAIDGVVATQYRETGREFDVRVRLSEKDRNNIRNLNNLLMYSQVLDALIPLKEVATIERGTGPSEIKRADQERMVTISADIAKNAGEKKILDQVQRKIKELDLKPELGFQVEFSGKAREVRENFSKIIFAFALAVILNYMIMASQFESFLQPFIIMLTVPLALFGVAVALLISGTSLNVISFLGIVLLAGTAVNNAIILIEYINQARERGLGIEEAAVEAVRVRTRPILMSSLTTVIGLAPLVFGGGEGKELHAPMAIAMMGGTLSATFLTLFVIPCFYIVLMRLAERFFGGEEEWEKGMEGK